MTPPENAKLTRDILLELIEIMAPKMSDPNQRRSIVNEAFIEHPGLIRHIEFTGPTHPFLVNLIAFLRDHGEIEAGKSALAALMETVSAHVGLGDAGQINAWLEAGVFDPPRDDATPQAQEAEQAAIREAVEVIMQRETSPLQGAPLDFEPTWLHVPAGPFTMGSHTNDLTAFNDEMPQHELNLDYAYWIARGPVTNAQYRAYIQDTGKRGPRHWLRGGDLPDYPVLWVNWYDGLEYGDWLTGQLKAAGRIPAGVDVVVRLATEAEWEKAARGADGRVYPWGDEAPDPARLNFDENIGGPTPVGKYAKFASPYGCVDMAGNVWEWTLSMEKRYPYDPGDGREAVGMRVRRTLRGGAYDSSARSVRCATRTWNFPEARDETSGFRVALVPR